MNTESHSHPHPNRLLVVLAFAAVYVVWGSTYFGIRVAIETLPPFLMAGTRYVIAGVVLLAVLRLRGETMPTGAEVRAAAVSGVLLFLGGNGLVCWAEQSVTSTVAALTIATTPVWFALLDWVRPNGKAPHFRTWAGIAVGFIGVTLLAVKPHAREGADSQATTLPGIIALLVACLSWAAGSVYYRHAPRPRSPFLGATLQMIFGGASLLLTGLVLGESGRVNLETVSVRSALAFAYLIVFGSWLAFSAYVYLLQVSTPAKVATYAYVNPVIAVLLGWGLGGEPLTGRIILAAAIIIGGVAIISVPPGTVLDWWRAARLPGVAKAKN